MGFADDEAVKQKYHIKTKQLARPRPVRLADGTAMGSISEYFTLQTTIGHHTETTLFFVTRLSRSTPLILGMPWLKKHNPHCDWPNMRLVFDSPYCRHHCLPWRTAPYVAPRGKPVSRTPLAAKRTVVTRKTTVESVPEEPSPTKNPSDIVEDWTKPAPEEPSLTKNPSDIVEDRTKRTANQTYKPNWKFAPKKHKAVTFANAPEIIPYEPNEPPAHKLPVTICAGYRRPTKTKRPPPLLPSMSSSDTRRPLLDKENIRCVRATSFLQFCKQKGVRVMRIHMSELEALAADVDKALADESALIEIPDLSEESFRRLVEGDYTMTEAKKVFSPPLHDFLAANIAANTGPKLRRKIAEADVEKFLKGKTPLTAEDIKKRLPEEFHHHLEHFLPKNAETLPPHRPWDHKIELIPGKQPPYLKNRPLSPDELRCVKKWIDEMLDKGFIRESSAPCAAPLLLAAKPGGGVRICQDYRGLNNVTVKNRYPLPLIRETLDSLCGAKYFTKLDIIAAFNRIRVAEGHEWKTAFITRFGLYENLVTPFGLCNAPATFQNYINHILHDILDWYCTAYLDDVLVYSKTKKEHQEHVNEVIRRLGEAGLQIDINKSEFYTKKTKYLGLIVSTSGLEMDPEKVKAIQEWATPTTLKELQQFLGFANFYRRFIAAYSGIIEPMTRLLRKETEWHWGDAQAKSFEALKAAFTTAPALAFFDYHKKTIVETDASNWASGGVLLQYGDDGKLHPVAFFSSKHTSAECNYEIYDKELLAIVKALEEWRPELAGAQKPFDIITDHKNLQTFMTTKQLNQRQVRWAEFLSGFNFVITYRPGIKATVPDALSRLPGLKPKDASDERLQHRKQILIPHNKIDPSILEQLLAESREAGDAELVAVSELEPEITPLEDLIQDAYKSNPTAQDIIAELRDKSARRWPKRLRKFVRCEKSECSIVNGLMYFRQRIWIPDAPGLRLEVVHRTHSVGPAGHPGRVKTIDLLTRSYWWPGMSRFVADFVQSCQLCFRTKQPRSSPPGFLKPLEIPVKPWSDISMDHLVDLPACKRNGKTFRHILVVVDRLTKMRHCIPVTSLDTDELVEAFVEYVYRLHGAPESVVSDRGSAFVSAFWRRLSDRLATALHPSSAFNPQTDGQTEIVNAAINKFLRAYVSFTQDDWVDWLPLAEFAMNNQVNETTGISPFFANYGFNPRLGIEPPKPRPPNMTEQAKEEFARADAVAERFQRILDQLKALAAQSQQRYEDNANTSRSEAPLFKEGDLVMVSLANLKTNRPKKKWDDKWDGPYKVLKAYRGAVVVELPEHIRVNNSFHTSKVRLWNATPIPGQDEINRRERRNVAGRIVERNDDGNIEERWEFEKILDVHDEDEEAGLTYLVKWKYHDEPTWQPEEDLKSSPDAVKRFHQQNPSKPGPPAWIARPRGRPRRT